MSEASYSLMLRNLSSDYYHNHIGVDEYRAQRKIILDKIDRELNGREPEEDANIGDQASSIFMQTVGFCNNREIDS